MNTVSRQPERASKSKEKAKELRSKIDASIQSLADAIDEVRASEAFIQFLDVQSRFHNYSWHNTLLIASQRADATRVAGFNTWKKIERIVRKGEKGIMIFAPCKWKKEIESNNGDTDTLAGIYFKPVYVFDVSQTDGKDIPTFDTPDIETVADDLLSDLIRVTEKRGIAITFQTLSGGIYGVSKKGSIEIDNQCKTGQQANTLAHELAHEAIHWDKKEQADRGPLTRSIAELEAEAVAYIVCKHFGLDAKLQSSRYIALWNGNTKALKSSLDLIAKTVRRIIDDVDSVSQRKQVA